MKPYARRKALESIFAHKRYAQFGQKHDHTTANGSEACTHVCLQALIFVWTGQDVTIDEISDVANYRPSDDGMNSGHVDRVIAHYGLPYTASFRSPEHLHANDVLRTAREVGPVLVAVPYGLYPLDWRVGFHDGPNGEALQGGRNDLSFAGNHATLMFSARWRPKLRQYRPRFMDPDHGSPSRPEIPPFDIFTQPQFARMWNHDLVGKDYGQFAYLPTKELEL